MNGKPEKHFGCTWRTNVLPSYSRSGNEVKEYYISLCLENPRKSNEWRIEADCELMLDTAKGPESLENCPCEFRDNTDDSFFFEIKGEDLKKYLIDGKLRVEFHVCINKMIGMQLFDEPMKKYSDVVLIVEDEKFYVLKLFLASQSSYFESLLLGDFKESKQSEVTLSGISAADFQNYLEALHGHSVIDDKTVNGIVEVANMYDTPSILQKCQIFIIEHSKKSMKEKLRIAGEYQLSELKYDCFHKIKTVDDIRAAVPSYSAGVDHHILAHLFDKLMKLQPTTTRAST